MQEIKKPSIVIASVLKPVDDTRMFEKMAKSLALTGQWNIHVIGYGTFLPQDPIMAHPLGLYARISIGRIFAPLRVLGKLFRIKPKAVIINTHELLFAALAYKLIFKVRIIYDVRENYFLNILHTQSFPSPLKHFVARWVRFKEQFTQPLIDHYLLAEAVYQEELHFIGRKFTVVENKCALPENYKRHPSAHKLQLLFTGTIDTTTGILEVINLVKLLNTIDKRVELHIAGYCAFDGLRKKIVRETHSCSYITYSGLDTLVHHSEIFEAISQATAGLVYYPPSPHTKNRIPTKVYEYMACRLPIIYDHSAGWSRMVEDNKAGFGINFSTPDAELLLENLGKRYYPNPLPSALWATEAPKLLRAID